MKFVAEGRIASARVADGKWKAGNGYVVSTGMHYLYAGRGLGAGDFTLTAKVSLDKLDGTAAALVLDGNQFGFEGQHGRMFVQGPHFGKSRPIADPQDFITAGHVLDSIQPRIAAIEVCEVGIDECLNRMVFVENLGDEPPG